jgi:hypothetical protein
VGVGVVTPATFTVKVKLVVWVTPPPVAVTVIVTGPVVAEAPAVSARTVLQLGLQEVEEKVPVTPVGRPETE